MRPFRRRQQGTEVVGRDGDAAPKATYAKVVETTSTEPAGTAPVNTTLTSTLPGPLPVRDVRLLVLASLLNEIEDAGIPTGLPAEAHQRARLVTARERP